MEVRFVWLRRLNLYHALQGLLDFSREFDVSLMDKVVMALYTGSEPEVCATSTSGSPGRLI